MTLSLVNSTFPSSLDLDAQRRVDDAYLNHPKEWTQACIRTAASMGFFSSDRCIREYAQQIWNITPSIIGKE